MNAPEKLILPHVIAPEDHDRSKFLGGADIGAAIGISPWLTPLQLWDRKRNPRPEDQAKAKSKPIKRGIRWESVVGEMLVEQLRDEGHDVEIVTGNRRYRDPIVPFFAAEVDFDLIVDGTPANCELKTVHPFKVREWGESGSDSLPLHYLAQVLWGMGVTRRYTTGYLAALFGADELRVYPVEPDLQTISGLRAKGAAFWRHVEDGTPPDAVTHEDLSILFPIEYPDSAITADESTTERLMRLRAVRAEIKAREAEAEAIEFEIKRAMGNAGQLLLPTGKLAIDWRVREGKALDHEALKAADPGLYKQCMKPWTSRVFTVKPFSTEGI